MASVCAVQLINVDRWCHSQGGDNPGLVQIKHKWTLINEGVLDYNHKIREGRNLSICLGLTDLCDYRVMIDLGSVWESEIWTHRQHMHTAGKSGINFSKANDLADTHHWKIFFTFSHAKQICISIFIRN